jgi:hypothetical protein
MRASPVVTAVLRFASVILIACPLRADVLDFDALVVGSPVQQIGVVVFSEDVPTYDLAVVSRFQTTSGDRGLGVLDGGFEVFLPGDVLTFDFTGPVTSLGVSFVSSPNTPGGVFTVSTSAGNASSASTPELVLGDEGEVFTVSIGPAAPFTQAVITAGEGLYSYNLDDITFVPEADFLIGLIAGIALLATLHRWPGAAQAKPRRVS